MFYQKATIFLTEELIKDLCEYIPKGVVQRTSILCSIE